VYRVAREEWRPPAAGIVQAARVQTLGIHPARAAGRWVTGAAIQPDGRVVAIRTYGEIYLFSTGVGGRLTPARERPCNIRDLDEPGGGEAIDFLDDGALVLTSEGLRRRRGTIHRVVCH
jgi:hypothetical protein